MVLELYHTADFSQGDHLSIFATTTGTAARDIAFKVWIRYRDS